MLTNGLRVKFIFSLPLPRSYGDDEADKIEYGNRHGHRKARNLADRGARRSGFVSECSDTDEPSSQYNREQQ